MLTNRQDKDRYATFLRAKKSQSALEYMMTYGWAILIIVIVAVILYSMGIFNPASSISSTITGFSATPVSNAICTANGILRIAVGDTTGHRILIKNISATSNGKTKCSLLLDSGSKPDHNLWKHIHILSSECMSCSRNPFLSKCKHKLH
jgi:hypothetical protein